MQTNGSNARGHGTNGVDMPLHGPFVGPGPHRLSYIIASDFNDSRRVQEEVMAAVTATGFTDDEVFAIRLALEEAMINAIKHGNKHDTGKSVRIEATVGPQTLDIIIHDEGAGFDRSAVPDPLAEENLEKNSGRGILLIESYMDSAEWTDSGRRLRMQKRKAPALASH